MSDSGTARPARWSVPRWTLVAATFTTAAGTALVALLLGIGAPATPLGTRDTAGESFPDIAPSAGIVHPNVCGSPGLIYIFENIGSGGALFDFDGDGRLDVFVNNAGTTEVAAGRPRRVRLLPGPGTALLRQRRDGKFEDVTEAAGVRFGGWGTGVAAGDIENDGDLDLFVGAFGTSRLYVNNGDGTFEDATEASGLARPGFASSAAFLDYDRDGHLDLFVVNYVVFDLDDPPNEGAPCLRRDIVISCPPTMHPPMDDVLYHNRGDGTFEDVTLSARMNVQPGAYGLGVAVGDLDRDGWPDIYVANDTQANFLWHNLGDGTFEEVALYSGAALSENAQGQSGMGVDLGDADGDGWLDIQVNNFSEEPSSYYRNLGNGTFADDTARSGLGAETFMFLSWGSKFVDYDHDGALDLVVVNGHVQARASELGPDLSFRQRMQVFRGEGGRFREVTDELGRTLLEKRNHRGLAVGDIDRDGDLDLLVTLLDGPPLLLRNDARKLGSSVGIVLAGSSSNREGIGARITVSAKGRTQVREVTRSGSYLSASDAMAHFGLGPAEKIDRVEVRWPSGTITHLTNIDVDRVYRVRESSGDAEVLDVLSPAPRRPGA